MKVGIVSYWFNRGQAVVSRHLRSILDEQGHDTYILARLTRKSFFKPSFVDESDVWDQGKVTHGSSYDMHTEEYLRWVDETGVEVVFFDQNLQFDAINAIREKGVLTVGRFVWESFGPQNVREALSAFDCIYSLTKCEQERYKQLGVDSPFIQWGCHPDLLRHAKELIEGGEVTFFYPGGYLSNRKPTYEAIEAFCLVSDPRARLIIKAQHGERGNELVEYAGAIDQRIKIIVGDLPTEEYLELFSKADVSFAPSRWEGLGLHLYEAVALGLPTITNDSGPMNEMVEHNKDGLLFNSDISGYRRPSVPILEPVVTSMASALNKICDDSFRAELRKGVLCRRDSLEWSLTAEGYKNLLEQLIIKRGDVVL